MSRLGSLYIELGEPEGELCGCTCEVGDWAADEIRRLRAELEKYRGQVNQYGEHTAADALTVHNAHSKDPANDVLSAAEIGSSI